MNYKDFTLGDWIGHISGVIEDESELDGNEMRDLVEFLSTLKQEPCEDCISRKAVHVLIHELEEAIVCEKNYISRERDTTTIIEDILALPPVKPQHTETDKHIKIQRKEKIMQIVIDIPEEDYRQIKEYYEKNDTVEATYSYIYHGTPLPKGHGRIVDENKITSFGWNNTDNHAVVDAETIIEADKESEGKE